MKNKFKTLFVLFVTFGVLLTACGGGGPTALEVNGLVEKEQAWTEKEVKALDTMDVDYTGKDDVTETYTGVPVTVLLNQAGLSSGAQAVVFVADDGYTAEVSLEELNACADCVLAFDDDGGFRAIMPGFSGKLQVKGVIELQVK